MVNIFTNHNPPVRISRAEVEHVFEYAAKNCCLENYVLIRLFKQLGARTGEVCTLRVENIDFMSCHVKILDSKKKCLVTLPLDIETVDLLKLLLGNRSEGFVFRQQTSWKNVKHDKALGVQSVWHRIRKIAEQTGVQGFKPRTFRQYFAANWSYKKRGSLKGLQSIMRHNDLSSTDAYIEKMTIAEDVEAEYRVHMDPIARALHSEALPSVCRDCENNAVCKYVDEIAPYSEVVTGCKFHKAKITAENIPRAR